ncbi:hypothetical protein BGZ79_007342, partial [Entomortierella chlamydospora]
PDIETIEVTTIPEDVSEIGEFNILVLGERQSGKSTLIEAIKNYARQDILDPIIPNYTSTTDVKSTLITTSLPRFSVFKGADDQDERSQPNQLSNDDIRQYLSLVDAEYEQLKSCLHIRKDQQKLNPRNFNFRLIDTPGLNFIKDGSRSHITDGESGVFITETLPAIIKHLGSTFAVHLVLLVISDADNYDSSEAVNFYRDILPAFDFITVVAHRDIKGDEATSPASKAPRSRHKSPYGESHADQIYFAIDNIFIRDDPIRNCLARNDIRRVLELALLNEPVFVQPKKPSFIKDLDKFLEDRYSEVLKTIHDAVATTDESNPFHNILRLTKIQCDKDAHKETILSSSPLKLIFSRKFENTWDAPTSYGPIKVEMESECEIAHVDILKHNVEILKQDGGVGADQLRLAFRWTSAFHGILEIRIYVNAATTPPHSNDIQMNINVAVRNAVPNSKGASDQYKLIMEFLERYRRFHTMHRLTSANAVHPEAIQILTIRDIDQTIPIDIFQCVEKLETAYFNIADTYKSKIASQEKAPSKIIVDDGGSARSIYPAVNGFRSHLVHRRTQNPWSKIEYIGSTMPGRHGDMHPLSLLTIPIPEESDESGRGRLHGPIVETIKVTLFQEFKIRGSSKSISFPTRRNIENGYFTMWNDIELVFGKVKFVLHGSNVVPKLSDENSIILQPERIRYYPGVVLEVVKEENSSAAAETPDIPLYPWPSTSSPNFKMPLPYILQHPSDLPTDLSPIITQSLPDSVTTMGIGSQKDSAAMTFISQDSSKLNAAEKGLEMKKEFQKNFDKLRDDIEIEKLLLTMDTGGERLGKMLEKLASEDDDIGK